LNEGLRYERKLFHSLFATKDQKEGRVDSVAFHADIDGLVEGMSAFAEKRKARFTHC
jgi:enoyl-CoA hydratase